VSGIANLSLAPAHHVAGKKLVAKLVGCPTLGAPSRETQTNPLLDNYEGMAIALGGPGLAGVSMIRRQLQPDPVHPGPDRIVRLP
jgi:hypothetical protein